MRKMKIIKNINERLTYGEGDFCYGGDEKIKKVLSESPVKLPDDYIEFLRSISGDKNVGIGFQVDKGGAMIFIWSAEVALEKRNREFNYSFNKDFMNCTWMIGDDVGDLIYFYGEGNGGFGIYRAEAGALDINDSDKIADSLTEFLVEGVGIDVAITL